MGGGAHRPIVGEPKNTVPRGTAAVDGGVPADASAGPVIAPAPAKSSLYSEDEMREGERELKLFAKYFGMVSNAAGKVRYVTYDKGEYKTLETERYLSDRNTFFGSREAYQTYLATAVAELNETSGTKKERMPLRDKLDPNAQDHKRDGEDQGWRDVQEPYYAWTRKACENELAKLGDKGVDISKLAQAGSSARLLETLGVAEKQFGSKINYGGHNFRPKKLEKFGLKLGTISEHGFGSAMDIDAKRNPQISTGPKGIWLDIVAFSKVALTEAERTTWWDNSKQKELYDKIVAINKAFLEKVAAAKAAEKAAADKKAAGEKPAAEDAGAKKPEVEKIPSTLKAFADTYASCFFNLSWELVDALGDAGFKWGAGFSDNVDLHHFELRPLKKDTEKKKK